MGAGMFLTYRDVARELALAKLKSDFVSNASQESRTSGAHTPLRGDAGTGRLFNPG
jgi:hypothetical protein